MTQTSDRTRWYSARNTPPLHSGVYEFRSTLSPELTSLDFDQREGWGKFMCIGPRVIFQRYRPRLLDSWRGKAPISDQETNMREDTERSDEWLSLSQAPADLADGWYRIEPNDRFGPYAEHVRGRWLVLLKTGERCELPWSALDKFRFAANASPAELTSPNIDGTRDPHELTGTRSR